MHATQELSKKTIGRTISSSRNNLSFLFFAFHCSQKCIFWIQKKKNKLVSFLLIFMSIPNSMEFAIISKLENGIVLGKIISWLFIIFQNVAIIRQVRIYLWTFIFFKCQK